MFNYFVIFYHTKSRIARLDGTDGQVMPDLIPGRAWLPFKIFSGFLRNSRTYGLDSY